MGNVYTRNESDADTVTEIVKEQFANLRPHHKVYVRSIGPALEIFDTTENVENTTVLQHDSEGSELETLNLLWQYCQIYKEDKVVYLHSKGSYHPGRANELLRKYVTKGALSDECSNLPYQCNVCSSRFSPVPHPHTSGNMWLARCDYVQKLMDPNLFEEAMNEVEFEATPPKGDACQGLGRFSAEHWIHSHPTVVPCDLHSNSTYFWGQVTPYPLLPGYDFKPELKFAPRFTLDTYAIDKDVCGKWGLLLEDRLAEFQSLYGEEPPESWWGWNVYT